MTRRPVLTRIFTATGLLAVASWVLAAVVVIFPSAGSASADGTTARSGDGLTMSKTLTRNWFDAESGDGKTDTRDVSVSINKHTDLQSRERIDVSWSGAHPTGGRAPNPYGYFGLDQEYPVMILECRGTPDQVTPSTCFTSTWDERSMTASSSTASDAAVWLDDSQSSPVPTRVSGMTEDQLKALPKECSTDDAGTAYHYTPFVAANGTTFSECSDKTITQQQVTSAGAAAAEPANEIAAYTGTDGSGRVSFEARTKTENEALGCSATVACTLEVIPIMGISCANASDWKCNAAPTYDAGSSYDGRGPAAALTPRLWWSGSNWNNRFAFPLTFAPPPSVCTISGLGSPLPFYGSELLSQAALQWTPAYCLNKKRFNWQDNVMPDDAAFSLMKQKPIAGASRGAAAALVSGRGDDDKGIAYAPTAVTGWAIAFDVDKPNNGGEQTSLNLDARLIAKLLTESYPGSSVGSSRPGLEKNPWSMNLDPEFQKLNPGLDDSTASEAASTLMMLSTGSSVIEQLTSYLAADPDAAAFLRGQADPWGMTVNPAYKNIKLPVDTWPLLDGWTPTDTGSKCLNANPAPYLQKIAAPTSSLRLVATALMLNWPLVSTICSYDPSTNVYKMGRVDALGLGTRFFSGLVTLGDARRYGLDVASLQASPGHFVAPTNASMAAALALATPAKLSKKEKKSGRSAALLPLELSQQKVRASATAYPGTMVVYTAAKTKGLDVTTAANVSTFIKVSTSEGQRSGRGNGQLPDGYLPITKTGATTALYTMAQTAARKIGAQAKKATPTTAPSAAPSAAASIAPPAGTSAVTPPPVGVSAPPALGGADAATAAAAVPLAKTAAVSSNVGGGLLPLLLGFGLFSGLVTLGGRVWLRLRGVR